VVSGLPIAGAIPYGFAKYAGCVVSGLPIAGGRCMFSHSLRTLFPSSEKRTCSPDRTQISSFHQYRENIVREAQEKNAT